MNKDVYKADWLLLLTALIWGSAFVAQRVGMDHVGPLTYTGVRFALGTCILLPFLNKLDKQKKRAWGVPDLMKGRVLLLGGLTAGCFLFLGAVLQQVGLCYTTAGKAGFITGLYVILVPLMGLFWGQHLRWGSWLGAILATVGLYLLSVTEGFSLAPGDMWVLMSAVFWAGHVVVVGWLSPRVHAIKLAAAQFAVCSALSMIGALLLEEITWSGIKGAAVPICYGGMISVGIAYTLQVVAQRKAPAVHAAIILSLESVFAALTGWLMLGEILTLRAIVGCLLMFAGMLSAQLRG